VAYQDAEALMEDWLAHEDADACESERQPEALDLHNAIETDILHTRDISLPPDARKPERAAPEHCFLTAARG
jgi:hypothetical protein